MWGLEFSFRSPNGPRLTDLRSPNSMPLTGSIQHCSEPYYELEALILDREVQHDGVDRIFLEDIETLTAAACWLVGTSALGFCVWGCSGA